MPDRSGTGPTLFRQIAWRLLSIILAFAVLDLVIVIVTYARHPEALAQELLTLEAERVAAMANPAASSAQPGTRNWSARVVTPHSQADSVLIDWTRREAIEGGYRISGVRKLADRSTPRWIRIQFDTVGIRPFVPVILDELGDHVAVPLVPLSFLLLLFSIGSVRRLLAPLQRAETEVDALFPEEYGLRLSLPAGPREVNALVRAINRALSRVESSVATLRDFTANAAHELRTPLTILQLTIDQLPDSPAKANLQDTTSHMTRLVGQMLDLAQAEALVVESPVAVDLAAIGRAVVALLSPKGLAMGQELRFTDHGNTIVNGHAEAIFRIYRNLVDNALAHAPSEMPVEIAAGPGPQISVRDHGPGIPPADQPHLFERFWRRNRGGADGAGLGLGIVKRLVDAHGASITLVSPPDGGALFQVQFPAPAG